MARVLSSVASTEADEAEAGGSEAPSLGRLLIGVDGLVGGLGGAIWIALVTLGARLIRLPSLYETGADVWTHLAAEVAAGAALWLVVFGVLAALAAVLDRLQRGSATRRSVAMALSLLLGAAFGAFVCQLVLRRSAYWWWLPAPAWWGSTMLLGAVTALGVRWVLALPPPRRAFGWGALVLVAVVAPQVWSLHRYVRAYGHVLGILQVGTAVVAAVGARLVAAGAGRERAARPVMAVCVATAILALTVSPGSFAARRAVLVMGGVAKHFTLDVLWPLADRDGDGIPSIFWGADPDDHDSRTTPVPGLAEHASATVQPAPAITPAVSKPRDLLFVIVDTTRLDSFDSIVADDPAVRRAFASFGYYHRYSSCSTRTDQVLVQLLENARCDDRALPGGATSLLGALRAAGYRDSAFRYYGVIMAFETDDVVRDDSVVVERARRALSTPSTTPRAIFVHLRGGHNEYDRTSGTPRERYERQLHLAFSRVASLVEAAPPERFVVTVLGDHGEAFGEHLSFAHANMLYEEVLATPFLIRSPVVSPGRHGEELGCRDVAWHVLAGLGLASAPRSATPSQYAALDLLPGQFGRTQRDSMRALRQGSHKVIYTAQTGTWELYDLAVDPLEQHSLADRKPALLEPMRAELLRIASSCVVPPTVGISTAE